MADFIDNDLNVNGTLQAKFLVLPNAIVSDIHVGAFANIASTKLRHRHIAKYAQPNTAATAETRAFYVAQAAGTIQSFAAGSIAVATSSGVVTVDLKKNGTTVLTGVVTLNSSSVARIMQAATVSVSTYVAGDFFEVVITATSTVLPTGLFIEMVADEAAT